MPPFNGNGYDKGLEDGEKAPPYYIMMDTADVEALVEQFNGGGGGGANDDHSRVIAEIMQQFRELSSTRAESDRVILEGQDHLKKAMERLEKLMIENKRTFDEIIRANEEERERVKEDKRREQEREERRHVDLMKKLNEIKCMIQQRNNSKYEEKCLAVVAIEPGCKWYVVERQHRRDFDRAIDNLLRKYAKKSPTVLKKWYGISKTVANIGKSLKQRLDAGDGDNLRWSARGNILSVVQKRGEDGRSVSYTNEVILRETEAILRANADVEVYREIDEIMNSI